MEKERIFLSLATMTGREQHYVQEAFDTNWVAPLGPNVNAFERELEEYLGEGRLVSALSSGTAALHLGLIQMGVEPGDEVICQTFTFAASANPVVYLGGKPVFVDSEEGTWNMCPETLERAIVDRMAVTGRKPKAIVPVHLYGMPARMDEIMEVARRYGIPVLEDAAEALSSTYKGKKCGTLGDMACLSFNGNKIITTSGGGALVCHKEAGKKRTVFLATQARDNAPYYQHTEVGYNYRLSNVCAGIDRGQLTGLDKFNARRKEIHALYEELLKDVEGVTLQRNPSDDFDSNYWLTCIVIDESVAGFSNKDLYAALGADNIESRPLWKPMHLQPVFKDSPFYGNGVSERLFKSGLCLPSGAGMTNEDVERVVEIINSRLNNI